MVYESSLVPCSSLLLITSEASSMKKEGPKQSGLPNFETRGGSEEDADALI
jgi:hypothetical protein